VKLEVPVESRFLNELRPTQIDAVLESEHALIAVECKFTEHGGGCSQIRERRGGGSRQCDGSYRLQTNPSNGREARCALSGKGIRYWDYVPRMFGFEAGIDHSPCPFSGEWFQWMRNLAAAHAMAEMSSPPREAATLVVYADAPDLPAAETDWTAFRRMLRPDVRFDVLSYQEFIALFRSAARFAGLPGTVWQELDLWVRGKIARVAGRS
jgi:hypothetical protein